MAFNKTADWHKKETLTTSFLCWIGNPRSRDVYLQRKADLHAATENGLKMDCKCLEKGSPALKKPVHLSKSYYQMYKH